MNRKSGVFALFLLSCQSPAWSFQRSSNTIKPLPADGETCFSPDEPCSEKLVRFIDSAKNSIEVAIYSINLEELVDTLIKKSEHVKVRIICDKVQSKGVKSKVKHLLESGVNIRYGKQKGIMHNKFTIIDDKMIETGSFNYTNHASTSNEENQIYLANSKVVNRYVDRFSKMWENAVEIDIRELTREIESAQSDEDQRSLPAHQGELGY